MATTPSLLDTHATNVAFAADTQPATTHQDLANQLETAADNLDLASINGTENLRTAARYITDALTSDGDNHLLLNRAARALKNLDEMVDEFRDMVA